MPNFGKPIRSPIKISPANNHDLLAVIVLFIGGAWFLWDATYWAGIFYIGNAQWGDAAFWWNGALHFSEGIIKANPNLDFRMGYALLAGIFVAVLGGDFLLFHKLLIAVFLFVASVLYFSLKPAMGRIAAAGATALLIFSPFTAEWLSVSTSDSTGLILNMAALSCLIFGLRNSWHLGFISAFGFLLASASLTRPLMSPFIAAAIVIIVLYSSVPWKRRAQGMASMLAAFAVPTLLWVIVLHGITGSWAMAGEDSTAFYAASDPQTQVWTPAMYDKVRDSARNRYKTQTVTQSQVNQEFWLLAKENYVTHLNYHISRIVPHILDIARFSNKDMTRNSRIWDLLRRGIIVMIVIGLAISSAMQKRWLGASLVGFAGLLIVFLPLSQLIVITGGAILFAASALRSRGDRAYAILAFYWWIGVAALFLVGGTWGPPIEAIHGLNALGYRLGSQFFFLNDLLTVAMLGLIATLRQPSAQPLNHSLSGQDPTLHPIVSTRDTPRAYAPLVLSLATYIFLSGLVVVGVAGAGVVGYRAWQRTHEVPQSFPPLGQLQTWWEENKTKLHVATPLETVSNIFSLNIKIGATGNGGTASSYILFTGGMSDFVWNVDGQARSQAIVYFQDNVSPLRMFPNLVYVEFPLHLRESEWKRKQGAWVVRRLPDLPPKSTLPFYYSETSVKAFVPLSEDKKQFDFSAAQIFPLQRYASQLHAAGELKVTNGILEWDSTSGVEKYPRRFSLKAGTATNPLEPVVLDLNISKAVGVRSLSFRWLLERTPNSTQPSQSPTLKVLAEPDASESHGKSLVYYTENAATDPQAIRSVNIDLTQSEDNKVRLVLEGVKPDDKVWFYEFNLRSDEFVR